MISAAHFRRMFQGVTLEIDDLFLLEPFQIGYLAGWVPEREFAAILAARPDIRMFLTKKCPQIAAFINSVLERFGGQVGTAELADSCDTVVWTIADMLVYNKCPEVYDALPFHNWDFAEIT